jgi:hemerythrin-like domain-containing protein
MNAIQELLQDHDAIAGMLARFARAIDDAERTFEIDRETIERLLQFFEHHVDGHHQEKEEKIFLPCLMRRVTGEDRPEVRKLFREHREDRRLLAMMRSNLAGASYGEPNCIRVLARYGRLFVLRERRHAEWEESTFFPLAERVLTPRDQREILNGFRELESHHASTVAGAARQLAAWLDQQGAVVHA